MSIALRLGHSPDPDDAFMWWPITGKVRPTSPHDVYDPPRLQTAFSYAAVPLDIADLNRRAMSAGDLDVTAISAHTYPHVAARYRLLSCGWSVGNGYGPKLVARSARADVSPALPAPGSTIAIPGLKTTAMLVLSLLLGEARRTMRWVEMPFHSICDAVRDGVVDYGLVIHEAQLTFGDRGLAQVVDLGQWWKSTTDLPLPLGLNVIRRDVDSMFGGGATAQIAADLHRSLKWALMHEDESLEYAATFAASGANPAIIKNFVRMYVNDLTVNAGPALQALGRLFVMASQSDLCPKVEDLDAVEGR